MKQNKLMRLQSLLVVMLTMFSMSAMAGSNKDYYSKVTVKAVGEMLKHNLLNMPQSFLPNPEKIINPVPRRISIMLMHKQTKVVNL